MKRCLFCQQEITVTIDQEVDPTDARLFEQKEVMCQACARARGLDPNDRYFVFAGDMYQKFFGVHLRLWPVGTFH
jgi:hypothetical protein